MLYGVLAHLCVDGNVLMVKKGTREGDPNSGYYTIPGGKLEEDEMGLNPGGRLEAAIREVEEETGLTLIKPVLRGVILFDNKGRKFPNWLHAPDYLVHIFSAKQYVGELEKGDEGEEPIWVSEQKIMALPKNPGDVKMYRWLEDPRFFIGAIRHDGDVIDEENTFVDYF